jgi:hypothetical protein
MSLVKWLVTKVGDYCLIPGWGKLFLFVTTFRTAQRSNQPLIQWLSGALSSRVMRSERETEHLPPCIVVLRMFANLTPLPHTSLVWCLTWLFCLWQNGCRAEKNYVSWRTGVVCLLKWHVWVFIVLIWKCERNKLIRVKRNLKLNKKLSWRG